MIILQVLCLKQHNTLHRSYMPLFKKSPKQKVSLMIYEETSTGSTTLDTDLKGYVSRDGGTTYTQTPLTLDTTYETGKTLVSGSIDISGQPSGTNMKYKIETLNQSASKICRIHGASLLWA